MKTLYLKGITNFHLLLGKCRWCDEITIHGFYHQIKSAGSVEIYPERKRAWHRWQCKDCGRQNATMFRLTTSTQRLRVRLFHWLEWSKSLLDLAAWIPQTWPTLRHVALWMMQMEHRLPL